MLPRNAAAALLALAGGAHGMWAGTLPDNVIAYKGCYQDDPASPMFGGTNPHRMVGRGQMGALGLTGSIANCADKCRRHGIDSGVGAYTHFGIKDSCSRAEASCSAPPQCWCGNNVPPGYDLLDDSRCPSAQCYVGGDRRLGRPCGDTMTTAVYQREERTDIAGDPFTTYNNRKVQFYLPVHVEAALITCGSFELFGRVMSSGIPGDSQQWFDMFRMRIGERDAVTIERRDTAPLLPSVDSVTEAEEEDADIAVPWKVDKRVRQALATARREVAQTERRALTTLNVSVEGAVLTTVSSLTAAGGRVDVVVSQDASRAIGKGFVEAVNVNAEDIGVRIESSMATKFTSEMDRIKKMHMDMTFTHLNVTDCTGPLPELWGIREMSGRTAKYLVPVVNDTKAQ